MLNLLSFLGVQRTKKAAISLSKNHKHFIKTPHFHSFNPFGNHLSLDIDVFFSASLLVCSQNGGQFLPLLRNVQQLPQNFSLLNHVCRTVRIQQDVLPEFGSQSSGRSSSSICLACTNSQQFLLQTLFLCFSFI